MNRLIAAIPASLCLASCQWPSIRGDGLHSTERGAIAGAAIARLKDQGLACVERRYAFEVEWADPRAPDEMLVEQSRTRRISAERYTCVPNA